MKTMTILGTRPEMIKMSAIVQALETVTDHVLVHTGQNFDPNLKDVFLEDLGMKIDISLDAHGDTLAETIAKTLVSVERVLIDRRPDAVVIHGDTNSALAGIIVKRMGIPLFHLEAGNRSFDDRVPEEVNRRLIDHISDINLAYSENARQNLLMEGLPRDRVFVMGSPMDEVIANKWDSINRSKVLTDLGLTPNGYILASIHRGESTESPKVFTDILKGLDLLGDEMSCDVILSTHPRVDPSIRSLPGSLYPRIRICTPFNFTDYIFLQIHAILTVSDSGTISEEAALLRTRAITPRSAIERPEAVDRGVISIASPDPDSVLEAARAAMSFHPENRTIPSAYLNPNCSERVAKIVLGYTQYVNRKVWNR